MKGGIAPMNQTQQKSGFTIIEVVLVLAIAGLIFLMVFIALPALQRSQRDQARKSEASTVISAIGTYQGNNRQQNPTAAQIGGIINNSSNATLDSGAVIQIRSTAYGSAINVTSGVNAAVAVDNVAAPDEVLVYFGYKCGGNGGSIIRGTNRTAAVLIVQESGNAVYCANT